MQANDLRLKTVESLQDELFFVPAYQRGYRWTVRQVTELLEDVWEFAQSGAKSRGEFYCLQPVVVSRFCRVGGQAARWSMLSALTKKA